MKTALLVVVILLGCVFEANGALYTITDLGSLGGNSESQAFGINSSGSITGQTSTPAFESHVFLYSGGTMQDLGGLGGSSGSYGTGINTAGQISGWAYTTTGIYHAFRYSAGVIQ